MFQFAFLIGSYSYIIFFLGILHLLNKEFILAVTIFFLSIFFLIFRPPVIQFRIKVNKLTAFLISLILILSGINLIGTLGPELGFDALWYHLTMPKIYIEAGRIFYIGGHLYYSAMPQLTEMYYLVGLALGNEIVAKIIHYLFGILSMIALYKISRLFLSVRDSCLTTLAFYSNLVVGWMSITAYIDLSRTFFETMALWAFLVFIKSGKLKWLITLSIMVGFAASTKILSIGSVILYLLLFVYLKFYTHQQTIKFIKLITIYLSITLVVVLPWLLFSYFNTGNPLYPLFSSSFQPTENPFSLGLMQILKKTFRIFLFSPDPISPIYIISLPLIGLFFARKLSLTINLLTIYVLFNIVTLYFTPIESSGRFILPYLPAFTLLFMLLLTNLKSKFLYNFLFITIILITLSSIAYRGVANKRFIPYLLGKTTLSEFMMKNMEFEVGNFFDTDGYFKKTITTKDKVLIYGVSNLYYVNFPYIHGSWAKKDDKFNYILIKNIGLPEKFIHWKLIYQNPLTKVKLYSLYDK